jgi:hypothetical protein
MSGLPESKRQVRLLLEGARSFKKTSTGGLDRHSDSGLVWPIVDHNQIIVAAFGFLQQPLQQISLVVNTNN